MDDALLADDLNATPQFIGALTELVYTQIGMYFVYLKLLDTTLLDTRLQPYYLEHQQLTLLSEHIARPGNFFSPCWPQSNQYGRCHAAYETQ